MSGLRSMGPREMARRAMLSALAGGGLTAASLGGPLTGGALGAEVPTGSTTTGQGAQPPVTSTTPETGTSTTGPGESSTSTSTTPSTTPTTTTTTTTAPTPPPAPAATTGPSTPPPAGQPAGAEGPVIVVRHKQRTSPSKPAGNLTQTKAKPTGGQSTTNGKNASTPGGASVPAGGPNDVALPPQLVAGQASALAAMLGGSAASAQALDFYRIPLFLLPIYRAAAIQYDVPWPILAAINEVETNYGTDLSVSSAGAEGWMQFEPATWLQYGVDALNAGYADPYNPVDAIFAAARYLHAAGASGNLRTAILAYNHSDEYASSVLLRAKLIATYPGAVIATLTGLVDGRPPVTGKRIGWDAPTAPAPGAAPSLSSSSATAGATPSGATTGATPSGATAGMTPPSGATAGATPSGSTAAATAGQSASQSDPATQAPGSSVAPAPARAATAATVTAPLQLVDVTSTPNAKVVAVQDGRIVRLGSSRKLGKYVILQDVYGDVFTYAGLGSIAPSYMPPKPPPATSASAKGRSSISMGSTAAVKQAHEPAPTQAASAGGQPPLTLRVKTSSRPTPADAAAASSGQESGSPASTKPAQAGAGKVRLFAHPHGNPDALAAEARAKASGSVSSAGGRRPLRSGSIVAQGTVLGRVRTPAGAKDGHLRFAIRPAGDPSTIDPRAILSNWSRLDAALHPQGAKGNPNLLGATASDVFLLPKSRLEREVLSDPGIALSTCSRHEVASGAIDKRALGVLAFLSRSGLKPTVGTLRCGDGAYAVSGYVAAGHAGDAIAITQINGVPIAGHQGSGSIADTTIRTLLTLQGQFVPARIVSLMRYPGAPTTLARADHGDYIEIVFTPAPVSAVGLKAAATTTAGAHSAGAGRTAPVPVAIVGELSPAQWEQLITRIAALPAPTVAVKPSSAAILDNQTPSSSPPQAASSNHGPGSSGSPPSGG